MLSDLEEKLLLAQNKLDKIAVESHVTKLLIFIISEVENMWPIWKIERYKDSELYRHADLFLKEAIDLPDYNASPSDILDFKTRSNAYVKEVRRNFPSNFSIKNFAYFDYKKRNCCNQNTMA